MSWHPFKWGDPAGLGDGTAKRADAGGGADDDYWYQNQMGSGVAQTGSLVTPETAMRVSAVFACVRIIAQSVAVLPFTLYTVSGAGRIKAVDHPLFNVLTKRPNSWQTAYEFFLMQQAHLCLRGNAYARIVIAPTGNVEALLPLHPDRVRVYRLLNGRLRYEVRDPLSNTTESVLQEEMLHVRGLTLDGLVGMSPIAVARETIGGALGTQDHANRLFANGARPGGILTVPGKLSDAAAKRVKEDWQQKFTGPNAHRIAVFEDGMAWQPMSMTPEDAQFLQTRQFQVLDIARIFGVPPHKLGELSRSTHSNIEHQGMEFVTDTLMPWLVAWEQAVGRDLMTAPEQDVYHAEFQVDALLRGDTASRYAAYAVGRQWGWLNADEIRKREGMDPIGGLAGDAYLRPLNMVDASIPATIPAPGTTAPAGSPA